MAPLREVFAQFGIATDDSGLKKLDAGVQGVYGRLQGLAAALAGGAIVSGLRSMVQHTAEAGAELNDSALRLGFATDELQTWRYAAKLAGVDAQGLEGAFQKLNLAADNAKQGSKTQAQAFKTLGVAFKGADGALRPTAELLPEIADSIARVGDPAKQSGLAVDLFGRAGVKLLPLLKEGSAGLAKYKNELQDLGGLMSGEAIAQADEYGDNLDRLDFALGGLRNTIVLNVLPSLTSMIEKGAKLVAGIGKLIEQTNLLKVAAGVMAGLGARWAIGMGIANAGTLAMAAGIAIAVLAIEDFYTLMNGGKSVIGDFLDTAKPLGYDAKEWVAGLTGAWRELLDVLYVVNAALGDIAHADTGGSRTKEIKQQIKDREETAAYERANAPQLKEERQKKAIREGDSKAFYAQGGTFEQFKERRLKFLNWYGERGMEVPKEGIYAGKGPSEEDKGTFGAQLIAPKQERVRSAAVAAGGKAGKTIQMAPTNIQVTVPPGTSREMADQIARIAGQEIDRRTRSAVAALAEQG